MQAALTHGERPSNRVAAYTVGPSSLAHAWAEQFTTRPLDQGPLLPPAVWPQGVPSYKSEYTITESTEPITKQMYWFFCNPHIAQTRTYIMYIFVFFFYSSQSAISTPTHFISTLFIAGFQPARQQAGTKKPAITVLSLKQPSSNARPVQ